MQELFIRITNSAFSMRDNGGVYENPEDATWAAAKGAAALLSDEIAAGRRSAAAEIIVEESDGTVSRRSVMTISVASLLTNANEVEEK